MLVNNIFSFSNNFFSTLSKENHTLWVTLKFLFANSFILEKSAIGKKGLFAPGYELKESTLLPNKAI